MLIEVLYKEFMIYGEAENIDYLKLLFPEAEFIETGFLEKPYFVDHDVDMLIMGPMHETNLNKVHNKLKDHREKLSDFIESGKLFIAINNSMDILGKSIEVADGSEEAYSLGIFPYKTVRDYKDRKAELFIGRYKDIEVIGERMGFSQYFPEDEEHYLFRCFTGNMLNDQTRMGGLRYKNAFLVDALGDMFITNPEITKLLLAFFGLKRALPFEEEADIAYRYKLDLLKNDREVMKNYKEI